MTITFGNSLPAAGAVLTDDDVRRLAQVVCVEHPSVLIVLCDAERRGHTMVVMTGADDTAFGELADVFGQYDDMLALECDGVVQWFTPSGGFVVRCRVCSEPIVDNGDGWIHDRVDQSYPVASCETGDGAVAAP
jgi:hypothetical protein